ncbi:MAG: tetratricopeptide repeat protein [Acidobacteria bacterium]|nr:tetratricopeptide repeat protein [Acidobacteriota bacterium]
MQAAAQIEFDTRDARARPTLEAIVKLVPANETAHSMLGELAVEARDCPRALLHFSKIASASRRPLARWQNGVCLFERERWQEAASEFQALLEIREHPPTRFNLAAPDADALSLKALVLRERNEIPQALEVLQGAVAAYPGDERLLLDLALLCLDQNSVDLGTAVLEAGLSRLPRSVRLLTALGVFQVRSGDMKRAEEYFLAAEQLAPQSGLGQVAAATAMIQLGLPDDAIRRLQTIIKPTPIVSLTLARALLQKGGPSQHRAEAKRLLASVVAREPGNSVAHSLLGKTLAQDGEVTRATQALEIAFRLDPSDRTAAYQLLLLYRRVGKTAQAALLNTQLRQALAKENADILEAPRYQLSRSPGQ